MQKSLRNLLLLASCTLLLSALPTRADVIAHWSFDELVAEGHAFPDVNGNLRAIVTDQSSATLDNSKDIPFGKAAALGPDGKGLTIPPLPGIYEHSFTIAAWVKLADAHEHNYLLADWGKPNAYAFGFDNGKVLGYLRNEKPDKKGNTTDIVSNKSLNVPITAGAWHHVAWVWDRTSPKSGKLFVYLDGNKAGELSTNSKSPPTTIVNNSRPVSIGYKGDSKTAFHGSIDELWIFNDALSADQITNLMKSNDINNSTELANAAPAAAAPASPTTPTTPTTPSTPANTGTSVEASATPPSTSTPDHAVAAAPTTPTDGNSGTSSTSPPPTFSVSNSTPGTSNTASPATPANPTTPTTPKPAAPSTPAPAPAFTVNHAGTTPPVAPVEPITPTAIAETPPPHYTPGRIAGIIASGFVSLSLTIFLFWAAQERGKMRQPR